jgi:hypothetical protein
MCPTPKRPRSCSARRGVRYPAAAHAVAVSASLRLHCAARAGVAPQNSLRSLRSLRSNSCGESDHEARWRVPTPALRCSSPQKSPPPGTARREAPLVVFDDKDLGGAGKAVGGCVPAATYAAPRSAGLVAARVSAHRLLTRRDCSSAANEVSVASFATGHENEHRREPEAKRRAAASERRRTPACGFATLAYRHVMRCGSSQVQRSE